MLYLGEIGRNIVLLRKASDITREQLARRPLNRKPSTAQLLSILSASLVRQNSRVLTAAE